MNDVLNSETISNNDMPKCSVCGKSNTALMRAKPADYEYFTSQEREFEMFTCGDCHSTFIHPRPIREELLHFYPSNYYAYNPNISGLFDVLFSYACRQRAKSINRLCGDGKIKIFDIGTGDCRHFDRMSGHGDFEFAGVEINGEMVKIAQDRGYDITMTSFEEFDTSASQGMYDVVMMNHLIEHVIDPKLTMEKARVIMKEGGLLMGHLPALDSLDRMIFGRYWGGWHFPRHLQLFTKAGFRSFLESCGFRDVKVRSEMNPLVSMSVQNWLVGGVRWKPKMEWGRIPFQKLIYLATMPFGIVEFLFGRGACMSFTARKGTRQTRDDGSWQ